MTTKTKSWIYFIVSNIILGLSVYGGLYLGVEWVSNLLVLILVFNFGVAILSLMVTICIYVIIYKDDTFVEKMGEYAENIQSISMTRRYTSLVIDCVVMGSLIYFGWIGFAFMVAFNICSVFVCWSYAKKSVEKIESVMNGSSDRVESFFNHSDDLDRDPDGVWDTDDNELFRMGIIERPTDEDEY